MKPIELLKSYWGHDSFREGQQNIVEGILNGRDVIAIMPTGAGKSVCYQLPAIMLPGITVVISPLISLMQDQVNALNAAGIPAAYINSTLSDFDIRVTLEMTMMGENKLLYVAPERLESDLFLSFTRQCHISMVTVDEAHCISQWGQDFRPSYLKIVDFIGSLDKRPIVSAFTATATDTVKQDIISILGLQDPVSVFTGFDRRNLYYEVEQISKKSEYIVDFLKNHREESGIIYCSTRKNTDAVHDMLIRRGFSAVKYHAGMDADERKKSQDDFIYDRAEVVVATNAFGMGIDKSNVRFVIHYNMPHSMENYYQEAGRAGRDGGASRCVLLFSPQDIMIGRFLINNKEYSDVEPEVAERLRDRDFKRLKSMEQYSTSTGCLRHRILRYFGENRQGSCGSCGNCMGEYVEADMTEEAKWVINCTYETKGRYGRQMIRSILRGEDIQRIHEIGADRYKSYGRLSTTSQEDIYTLIDAMLEQGYVIRSDDQYQVLSTGDYSPIKYNGARVMVKLSVKKPGEEKFGKYTSRSSGNTSSKKASSYIKSESDLSVTERELYSLLREERRKISRRESVPPYVIFSDKTLMQMSAEMPVTDNEMLKIDGVGEIKLKKYGNSFMKIISDFRED